MIKINIHEAKVHLSRYLDEALKGEVVVICRRNEPVAELRPLAGAGRGRRTIGPAAGLVEIPASFFEPLPDDLLDAFEGEAP